jgi:hypothetical protein
MVVRQYPRFQAAFSGTLIHRSRLHQINKALDLSRKGCRLESAIPAFAGMKVNLLLYTPEDKIPIFVRGAIVRWSGVYGIGIEFQSLATPHQERLNNTIRHLEATVGRNCDTTPTDDEQNRAKNESLSRDRRQRQYRHR